MQGRILKATGGFYYVLADKIQYECRARGLFRQKGISPLVGDWVEIEPTGGEKGYIIQILDRKNSLTRPPLANLDQLFLVVSVADPSPNLFVLDKLIAISEHKKIEPVLVVTKTDLEDGSMLAGTYSKAGFRVYCTGLDCDKDLKALRSAMEGKISAFCGNSGVGKTAGWIYPRPRPVKSLAGDGIQPGTCSFTRFPAADILRIRRDFPRWIWSGMN